MSKIAVRRVHRIHLNKMSCLYGLFFTAQLARSSAFLKDISVVDNIMTGLQIVCVLFCFWQRARRKYFSVLDIAVLFFYGALLISTVMVSRDFISWATYAVQGIGSVFLIENMIAQNEKRNIRMIHNISSLFVLCNLVSLFTFAGTRTDGYFFLGLRIGFTPFCLLAVVTSLVCDSIQKNKKLSVYSCMVFVVAASNLILQNVTTGVVGLIVFVAALVVSMILNQRDFRVGSYALFFILSLVMWAVIVVEGSIDRTGILSSFLSYFGEDTTFGGRTIIWQTALFYIAQKPILGYGVSPLGAFYITAYVNQRSLPAHDELLNILYQGGIIAFICWNLLFVAVGYGLCRCKRSYLFSLMMAAVFTFCCIMIVEIQSQKAILFLILALAYQLGINHSREESVYV